MTLYPETMKFRPMIAVIIMACSLITVTNSNPAQAALGDPIPGRDMPLHDPPFWTACSTLNQTDNCIESIEYLDPSSNTWIKGKELKNPWYKPGVSLPMREGSENFVCGTGNASEYDVCYEFPGAAIDGSTQYVGAIVYSKEEVVGFPRIKNSFVPLNGIDPRKPLDSRVNGWQALKPGSTWRMTLIADKVAKGAGLAWAWMKNPSIDVVVGTDGKSRLITSGSVQEVHSYVVGGGPNPCVDNPKNELTANNYRVEYSINIDPYVGEYGILLGTPPGGVFLNSNGGCNYAVKFDRENNKINVVSTGPHFDVFGNVITGWVEASIRGDVVRKVFGLEPKTMQEALVEVTDSDGTVQSATFTTRYLPLSDKVEIKGYGFHYSAAKIAIKLKKPEDIAQVTQVQTEVANTPKTGTVLPPLMFDQSKTKSIKATMKQTIVFTAADPGSWKAKISNSKVVKFVPGGNKGSWIANPGLVPLQPGSATVTIYNSKKSYAIKVLISS